MPRQLVKSGAVIMPDALGSWRTWQRFGFHLLSVRGTSLPAGAGLNIIAVAVYTIARFELAEAVLIMCRQHCCR